MIAFSGSIRNEDGPDVIIDCPFCGQQSVRARTRQQTDWLTLFHLIPLLRLRNVFVRCTACRKDMIAKCRLGDLGSINPATQQNYLVKSQSFVGKSCIVLGLLLCWAPMIGLIPAVIGFYYRKQFGPVLKVMSVIGLILSLITTSLLMVLLQIPRPKN